MTFRDSVIPYLSHRCFHDIVNMSRIELDNVTVTSEIAREAFANVQVRNLSILDSRVAKVNELAFKVQVGELFRVQNTRIGKLGRSVYLINQIVDITAVRPAPPKDLNNTRISLQFLRT